jgi:transcriptional regulator with XRE-family HTH domain
MASPDEGVPRIGMNVRAARRSRGMSLETLAGLTGRSKGWLSKIENGHARLERRQDIAAIAEALAVSADSILGVPAPEIRPGTATPSLRLLRATLLDTTIDHPPDTPARPVELLADLAASQEQAVHSADYNTMAGELPGILGELQVHAAAEGGPDRDTALRSLIRAYAAAMIMLLHFGQRDLAWVAADRGRQAALVLGDPVWIGAAAFECAMARPSAAKSRALLSASRRADELEPHLGDHVLAHQVYGMLRLTAALACSVQGNHAGAMDQAAEAARIAAPIGDSPDAFGRFGPANVGVWQASLLVEAGNASEALACADQVRPEMLASNLRRAGLGVERARAHAMLGADAGAIVSLRQAERFSPVMVRNNVMARELVADMLTRARREAGGRDLRGLAWRMNLI